MHHVISKLERIVNSLDKIKRNESGLNWQDDLILKDSFNLNSDILKDQLIEDTLSYTTEDSLKVYVRNMQTLLTSLLDKLYTIQIELNFPNTKTDNSLYNIISDVQQTLEKGFLFLEQSFRRHFDKTQPCPLFLAVRYKPGLRQSVQQIRELESAEAKELVDIIFEPIEKFVSEPFVQLSFQDLLYYQLLMKNVQQIFFKKPKTVLEQELNKLLIQINFNDAAFFEYYIRSIKTKTETIIDIDDRIRELSVQEKYLKQLTIRPAIALHNALPSIQAQLITWIDEEINFLNATAHNQQVSRPPAPNKPDDKIHLSVSVNVLGFLLKLFVAGGVITNTNQSDVIRFFARHCKTAKQEDISFDSLYNKYHQPNSSTIKIARDLFATLLQLISKLS